MKQGDRVWVSGDSTELWIEGYNVRVSTGATVVEEPVPNAKKILLNLDTIDGDINVCCFVRKNKVARMKESDFILDRIDGGKYCDYWFRIIGETKKELTDRYMEQSMVEVNEAVFSIQDGQWGIKRLFPFNYDVITPSEDKELYTMLKNVAFKTLREQNMKG